MTIQTSVLILYSTANLKVRRVSEITLPPQTVCGGMMATLFPACRAQTGSERDNRATQSTPNPLLYVKLWNQ